ncbi:MAG: YfhO family protein [Lewinellaceae bacterium]|nr:YfhO family protein [Lewinellaceae bacterium]
MNPKFKVILPHISAVIIFLLCSIAYFSPQLQGKVMFQPDLVQYQGMAHELITYQKETGHQILWTNSMFSGMPTYQISAVRDGNLLRYLDNALQLGIDRPIGRFLAAMLSFYLLLVLLGVNSWIAIIGGIAFGLTTNNLILMEAGHSSKVGALSYMPLIVAGILLAFREKYLLGGAVLAAGLGLNLYANHPQMTYYLLLSILIFGLIRLIYDIREKQLASFFKAMGALVAGALLAVAANASSLLTTLEYTQDTMRGKPILEAANSTEAATNSSTQDGLAWTYAMQWSNAQRDLLATFIPGAVGGSSQEKLPKNSQVVSNLAAKGMNLPADIKLPYYWGGLTSTSGPAYLGAIAIFLFILGLLLVKGPEKWWLAASVVFTMALSLGSHLEWFNRFFFDSVPLYNKFRAPSSILGVTAFLLPILSFLALDRFLNAERTRKETLRALQIAGGVAGGFALLMWLLGPGLFTFAGGSDASLQQSGFDIGTVIADRKSMLQGDALRSFFLIALAAGLLWAFATQKLGKTAVIAGVGVLVLFDVWSVGRRYFDQGVFITQQQYQANFAARPVDQQILQDPDPYYRVHDITSDPFRSAMASYHHKTVGGYHAAKLQRYDDLISRHLAKGNQAVFNMLNTKYFIVQGANNTPTVQLNPGAAGNAWFVSNIQLVATANAEIDSLENFDPAAKAFVHEEFQPYLQGLTPTGAGDIKLTSYKPEELVYQSNSDSEQLAVFSEVWYGPNKGWQAFIDGKPVDHIRANFVLRALRVPAGQHEIVFRFTPAVYTQGKTISLIASSILLLALLGIFIPQALHFWRTPAPVEAPPPPAPKAAAPKTAVRKKKK